MRVLPSITALCALTLAMSAHAEPARFGERLEGFEYPHPSQIFAFDSQGQRLEMSYMDIAPVGEANGRTFVLMHGKNFCGATWEGTIEALTHAGYRVVVPDQVGFCRSSKPENYHYSFHQLAYNTQGLMAHLGIDRYALMGHSMGGMLAMRHALTYPSRVEQLVLVNPIGLEDWKAKGVPYRPVDAWYAQELKTSAEGIRRYQQSTYYAGEWRPEYDRWVIMQEGLFQGEGKKRVAWNSALTYDMIFTQPVVYELDRIQAPTLLMIGNQDNTAIGKDAAAESVRATLGDYSQLGPQTAKRIPNAKLVTFEDLGHSPQIQDPERFHEQLLKALR